ncbi:hypothetical protein LSH36_488g04043 [Paralvinella palmiformis]|uniref:Uncharacterized protein n=1 Tax=Paralvinella palmiformis TaxID=53620 RepID=A0AAD9J8V8_9ANNE|nr:hypothetical protein LSH36_488g04043 [Paralvinella palmiformis]
MAVNVITSAPNPAFYGPSTQFHRQGSILYKRINPQSAVTFSDKTVNGQPSTRLNRYFTTLRFGNKSTFSPCVATHQSTSGSRPPQRPRTTVDGIRKLDRDKCIPETSDKQRITPDLLIEKLVERGVGRPKIYRHPPLPSEIITYRHYEKRHQIPFYLEKLKGKSRIDCDIANAKAMAFCEEHRDASDVQARTYSPLFRSRVLYQGAIKSGSSDGGRSFLSSSTVSIRDTEGISKTGEDDQRFKLFDRVQTWIEDCQHVDAKGFVRQNYNPE